MKRWAGPLIVLVISGLAAHFALLHFAPSVIMDQAMLTLAKRNIALHDFTTPRRIAPNTQAVVRSSPDLFYSLCRYDLSAPGSGLRVSIGPWKDYQSISFYDAETNNFSTVRASGKAMLATIRSPYSSAIGEGRQSPTARGVVLIRRLAPSGTLFNAARKAAAEDRCEYFHGTDPYSPDGPIAG